MTRGRRKDLTIPPSRALLQQRDYRARKAQYVADLEDRIRRAEDENTKLRKEIDSLRTRAAASGTLGPSPEVVAASSELMHQLTAAASCLARFQQLTFNEQTQQAHAIAQAQMQTQNLQPSPPELPPVRPTLPPMHEALHLPQSHNSTYPPSVSSHSSHSQSRQPTPPRSSVLHPSRQQQTQSDYHHHRHSLSPTLPPPVTAASTMRDYGHASIHMTQPETPRQSTAVPSSSSVSTSTSTSASSPSTSRLPTTTRGRSNSYAVYNEVESAWGYFDSRDLDVDEDEEDELYEEESPVIHSQSHRPRQQHSLPHQHSRSHQHSSQRSPSGRHTSVNGHDQQTQRHGGHASSHHMMSGRTSDMRSTTSSSGPEDSAMRMREDSPMRTR